MKALVKTKPEVGLCLQEVCPPLAGPNDVLIKIEKIAICGTDTHIYNWDEWAQQHVPLPLVIGHEFIGKVVEIGKEVQDYFKIGDRVSGENHIACGHCRNCRAGRAHLCRHNISIGVNHHGCFADFLCLPATNAYLIPDAISNEIGTILNPFGNAVHCALSFDLAGEDVLITGAGSVGMMAAAVAKHLGARHIVITDINDYRLELAKKMGVSLAVNPTKMTLKQVMDQLGMQEGFDVGLEMSGNAQAFNDMITHMNHAGKIALLGFLPDKTVIDWDKIIMKGITIKGVYGREMYDTWYKMISLLESGLNISSVITHEFSSHDFQKAFETMRAGQSGKIILDWAS